MFCALPKATISGEHLQDHLSSGLGLLPSNYYPAVFVLLVLCCSNVSFKTLAR